MMRNLLILIMLTIVTAKSDLIVKSSPAENKKGIIRIVSKRATVPIYYFAMSMMIKTWTMIMSVTVQCTVYIYVQWTPYKILQCPSVKEFADGPEMHNWAT